jgi:threonine dehydrogenase-like Zn-dependent dehydrogenase
LVGRGVVKPHGCQAHPVRGGSGGVCPARRYLPDLLPHVLDGAINPGRVFDYQTNLDGTPDAYRAVIDRRAIKSLLRIGTT